MYFCCVHILGDKIKDAATDISNRIQDKMPAGTQPGGVGRKPGDEWTQYSSTGELNESKKKAAEEDNPDGLDIMVCNCVFTNFSSWYKWEAVLHVSLVLVWCLPCMFLQTMADQLLSQLGKVGDIQLVQQMLASVLEVAYGFLFRFWDTEVLK